MFIETSLYLLSIMSFKIYYKKVIYYAALRLLRKIYIALTERAFGPICSAFFYYFSLRTLLKLIPV